MNVPALKIGKAIRLMASDRDGEVIAACHALRRMLAAVGCDLHDLAHWVEITWTINTSVREMAFWLSDRQNFSDKEKSFVANINRLVAQGRKPTPPQLKWLAIYFTAFREMRHEQQAARLSVPVIALRR